MSSWLDDDPELLRAALEIVDNWADDALALGVESFSPNESDRADSSDDKSRKVSKNAAALRPVTVLTASTMASTHHRRRTEIKYLREVVAELESQLRQLEHRRGGPADEGPVVIARMWRDIAARQRQLRQEAESDRAKLRSLLNTQAKAAKALMEQLEKARSIECEQLLKPTKRSRVVPVPNMRPPEGSQFLVLERLYTRCDGLFAYSKFHDGTTKFADIHVNNEPNGDILIDLHETWVLPFGAAQVLDAMWEYTMRDYGIRWEQSGNEPCSKTTHEGKGLVYTFSVRVPIGTAEFHHDGQVVARRFDGEHGRPAAIISNMQAGPCLSSTVPSSGTHVIENSCIRVQPELVAEEKPLARAVTRVQYTQQFHVSFDDDDNCPGRQHAGVFTNVILDKIKETMERQHGGVEDLLLQSSRPSLETSPCTSVYAN